ncbi:MAG: hypothetical protein FH749_03630 [Firmicutes bacterium]|nr:hypothetical protein [Bacillota bacterium]
MSIENRLKEDARKYKDIQPPADLREKLSLALENAAPVRPVKSKQPWKRWLAPVAVAALLALTILPLLQGDLSDNLVGMLNNQKPADTDSAEGVTTDDATAGIPDLTLAADDLRTASNGYVSGASFSETVAEVESQFERFTEIRSAEGLAVFEAHAGDKQYVVTIEERDGKVYIAIE